mmetsp:Transcript_29565/g.73836  ORF Transcript_29565/g.73836 Transcript_29565/m.73836 type:complete len:206 (-) Transcript_29565:424-1041(-)
MYAWTTLTLLRCRQSITSANRPGRSGTSIVISVASVALFVSRSPSPRITAVLPVDARLTPLSSPSPPLSPSPSPPPLPLPLPSPLPPPSSPFATMFTLNTSSPPPSVPSFITASGAVACTRLLPGDGTAPVSTALPPSTPPSLNDSDSTWALLFRMTSRTSSANVRGLSIFLPSSCCTKKMSDAILSCTDVEMSASRILYFLSRM